MCDNIGVSHSLCEQVDILCKDTTNLLGIFYLAKS